MNGDSRMIKEGFPCVVIILVKCFVLYINMTRVKMLFWRLVLVLEKKILSSKNVWLYFVANNFGTYVELSILEFLWYVMSIVRSFTSLKKKTNTKIELSVAPIHYFSYFYSTKKYSKSYFFSTKLLLKNLLCIKIVNLPIY